MKYIFTFLILILISIKSFTQEDTKNLLDKRFEKKITITMSLNYLLYLPKDYYSTDKKFPLVLFLHGAGERGNDLQKVKMHGPPKLIENGEEFPFILVAPQCPEGKRWTHFLLELSLLINEVQTDYRVDSFRVYLTGLSMGGQGTWALAMYQPSKFAALAPICGWTDTFEVCNLKDIPIWVFHGAQDLVVPIKHSEEIVETLKKCGSNKIKFTIYPEANHDSWTETYNNSEFYEWLLSNKQE